MSLKNYILRVFQMIPPGKLIWTFKTFSSFSSSIVPNPTCTGPVIFFLLGIPLSLLWISLFDTRSSKTSSSNKSGSIQRKTWNAFIKAWSPYFLFRAEEPGFLIFFKEIRGLGLNIKWGPSRIRFIDTWRKCELACLSFCTSFLASLSFFLFSVSCLLSSISSRLKT